MRRHDIFDGPEQDIPSSVGPSVDDGVCHDSSFFSLFFFFNEQNSLDCLFVLISGSTDQI
jgi:hypothetical protein